MTLLAALALALLLLAAGDGLLGLLLPEPVAGGRRWALAFATGLLALDLVLLGAHFAGLPWGAWTVVLPLAALSLAFVRRRTPWRPVGPVPGLGVGDGAALLALASFAALSATGWLIFPDLVYHWGIKAGKLALARGLDLAFLSAPTDFVLHPDYPLALTALVTATSLLAGEPSPWAGIVWGPLLAGALWLAGRQWLAERASSRLTLQLGAAGLGLYVAWHGIAFRRATDAGWLIALSLLLAAPLLARRPRAGDDLQLGLAAALAAAGKLEGLPLALFLVAAGAPLGRGRREGGARPRWSALLLPPALVSLPWLALVAAHGLSAETNLGGFDLARLQPVARAMLEATGHSLWAGFGWLTLALVAGLWLAPGQRRLAMVLALQLGFYLWAYLATPVDPLLLVETSFARLLGHLTPAALVAAMVAADVWATAGRRGVAAPATER